ncbi:MAG TPA: amidohydrolase, partial [Mycobacterium sp.]|nr:amidohydrolase [Mycobacterium sp.]
PAITTEKKKKILGLNAAKMYDIAVPPSLQLPAAAEPAVGPRGADKTAESADHLVGA